MRKTAYGKRCKLWRVSHTRYTQQDIADDLNCSTGYISKFESGKADNVEILVWYLEHGMPINKIVKEGEEII